MITSPSTRLLSKPKDGERVSSNALAYLRSRTRQRLFDLVMKNFRTSKITQAELARRLGKGTDRICKLLGSPGNWTTDTATDLLFAIDGCVLDPHGSYPLDKPARNDTRPHYLDYRQQPTKANTARPSAQDGISATTSTELAAYKVTMEYAQ